MAFRLKLNQINCISAVRSLEHFAEKLDAVKDRENLIYFVLKQTS